MADIAQLRVRLTADASGLKAVLVDAQQTVQRTGGIFAQMRDNITPLNQGVELLTRALSGLVSIGRSVAGAFAAPISAAAEQDRVTAGLEATLASSKQLTAEYANSLNELADAEALVKNVQDDLVVSAERTLVAFGATREELPKLLDATLDLATKTGDVAGAAFIMGKALQGETGTLARYGIFVDEGASKTEKLDQALKQIQERFGGQAAAAAATFAGRMGIVEIAIGQLQERIGQIVTQNPVVLASLSGIALGFTKAKDAIEPFIGPLSEAVSGLVALATVRVADAIGGLADEAKEFPALAAALRAFADGLRDSNTAALEAKKNLRDVSSEVANGATGMARFEGVVKEIGDNGRLVFRTIGAAIREVGGTLSTLTEGLNNADTQLKPLETIGENIGKKLQAQLPAIEDALVNFAIRVGEKMAVEIAKAIARGIKNGLVTTGPELDKQQAQLDADAKRTEDNWLAVGRAIANAFAPASAGAAEIPTAEIKTELAPPDPKPVDDVLQALQDRASAESLQAKLEVDTSKADASLTGFFGRVLKGMVDVAAAAAKIVLPTPKGEPFVGPPTREQAAGIATGPPSPRQLAGAVVAQNTARETQQARIDAALTAEIALHKQIAAEEQRANELAAKRASLSEDNQQALAAEVRAFNELNPQAKITLKVDGDAARSDAKKTGDQLEADFAKLNPKVKLGFDKTEADKETADFEQRVKRLDEIEPTVTPHFTPGPADTQLETFEQRVNRLDGLAPEVKPTVSVTTSAGATLDDMLAKARELDAAEPKLDVVAGQSFQQAEASVNDLLTKYNQLGSTKATPTVDTTQVDTGFAAATASAEQFQTTAAKPVVAKVTADATGLALTNKDLEKFQADVAKPNELNVDTTKAQGSFSIMKSTIGEVSADAKKGFEFTANTARVSEKLNQIRSDISAGVDPITITAEASQAQKVIDAMKASIASITDAKVKADLTLVTDKAQADLNALKANAAQGATMPVDANTTQADQKVEDLRQKILQMNADIAAAENLRIFEARVNVARGGGQITGNAASRDDLKNIVAQAGKDVATAIAEGDTKKLAELAAGLKDFRASFGTFQGQSTIPTDIAAALSKLDFALAGAGGIGTGAAGDLASQIGSEIQSAQAEASKKATEQRTELAKQTAVAERSSASGVRIATSSDRTAANTQVLIDEVRKQTAATTLAADRAATNDQSLRTPAGLKEWANMIVHDTRDALSGNVSFGRLAAVMSEVGARVDALNEQISRTNTAAQAQVTNSARTAAATEQMASSFVTGRIGGVTTQSVQRTLQRNTGVRGTSFVSF